MSKRQPGSKSTYSLSFKQASQPLARSLTFIVQLTLLFGLSSGSMFVAKGWLSQQGLVKTALTQPVNPESPSDLSSSRQTARVIWPSVPSLFPLPAAKAEAPTALASSTQLNPEVKVPQQQQDQYVYQAPAQAPRLSYRPQINTRQVVRPRVRLQPRQQRVSWRGAQLPKTQQVKQAPPPQHAVAHPQTQVTQIRKILKKDYGVQKTVSYNDSMKWVRETLKSYN